MIFSFNSIFRITYGTWYERYFLFAVRWKLPFSVSFWARKVDFSHTWNFTALVRKNQLYARKTTPTRLTFGVGRIKYIESRLTRALKYAFPHLIRNILLNENITKTTWNIILLSIKLWFLKIWYTYNNPVAFWIASDH